MLGRARDTIRRWGASLDEWIERSRNQQGDYWDLACDLPRPFIGIGFGVIYDHQKGKFKPYITVGPGFGGSVTRGRGEPRNGLSIEGSLFLGWGSSWEVDDDGNVSAQPGFGFGAGVGFKFVFDCWPSLSEIGDEVRDELGELGGGGTGSEFPTEEVLKAVIRGVINAP
jgi:hypothetical protein